MCADTVPKICGITGPEGVLDLGERVVLTCKATGAPQLNLQWTGKTTLRNDAHSSQRIGALVAISLADSPLIAKLCRRFASDDDPFLQFAETLNFYILMYVT